MAKADDTPSTWSRISWHDALTRTGSSEALLSYLRERPILAWHQGLYYWPSGKNKKRSEHGKIDPDWWAQARVDPANGRVIFLRPEKLHLSFAYFAGDPAPPAAGPPIMDEVFAFGIELERGAVEARWPAQPKLPEREHVETPAPAKPAGRKVGPKVWLAQARKDHPPQPGEGTDAYAHRLYALMQEPDAGVRKVWTFKTLKRRLYDS